MSKAYHQALASLLARLVNLPLRLASPPALLASLLARLVNLPLH
jgi:hypothetical protein